MVSGLNNSDDVRRKISALLRLHLDACKLLLALWASNQYLAASLRSCAPRGRPQFVVAYGLATKMKKCRSYKHLIKVEKNPKLKEKNDIVSLCIAISNGFDNNR